MCCKRREILKKNLIGFVFYFLCSLWFHLTYTDYVQIHLYSVEDSPIFFSLKSGRTNVFLPLKNTVRNLFKKNPALLRVFVSISFYFLDTSWTGIFVRNIFFSFLWFLFFLFEAFLYDWKFALCSIHMNIYICKLL